MTNNKPDETDWDAIYRQCEEYRENTYNQWLEEHPEWLYEEIKMNLERERCAKR